jgi:hypothetical protein
MAFNCGALNGRSWLVQKGELIFDRGRWLIGNRGRQKGKTRDRRTERGPSNKTLPVHPWSRRYGYRYCRSDTLQIARRRFAGPAIKYHLEGDLLSLVEAMHPGAFDSTDVHEHILAAVIRLDETEAFLAIKPFYRTLRHMTLLSGACVGGPRSCAAGRCSRFGEVVSPTRRARRGQVVRPKLDKPHLMHRGAFCKREGWPFGAPEQNVNVSKSTLSVS